jgi:hypothetical protein
MSDTYTCTINKNHKPVGVCPKFCSECGAPTAHDECASCGTLLFPRQKFCEKCGARNPNHVPEKTENAEC